jgi:hypothetical protein
MAEPGRDDADVIGRLLMRVYEIHERVIARSGGGLEGIQDAALLHAAVSRPLATFGEAELYPTDFDKAATLFHSLIKSTPFWTEPSELPLLRRCIFCTNVVTRFNDHSARTKSSASV